VVPFFFLYEPLIFSTFSFLICYIPQFLIFFYQIIFGFKFLSLETHKTTIQNIPQRGHFKILWHLTLTLANMYWCIILTINFGKPNSTFHLLSKKCLKSNLYTTFFNKKTLLSARNIFERCFILEKQMFLGKEVKGIGIWFPSVN